MDIIKKSTIFSKSFVGLSLTQIYKRCLSDTNYRMVVNRMSLSDFVKMIFLIHAINNKQNPNEVLEKINTKLFSVSTVVFDDDDPTTDCRDCDGSGTVTCYDCEGDGRITCNECDGDGIIEYENPADNIECVSCDGNGQVRCDSCDGGELLCNECEGRGLITYSGHTNFQIEEFLCIDEFLFSLLFVSNLSNTPISELLLYKLRENSIEIWTDYFSTNNDNQPGNVNINYRGEIHVDRLSETMDFDLRKTARGGIKINRESQINERFFE